MIFASAGAFRTALERRLLNASLETGVSLARLRKRVVFERLLARLLVVSPDRWVLKGAFALDLRLRQTARSTLDLDLGRGDSVDVATAALLAAQRVDVGDYFQYAVADIAEMDLSSRERQFATTSRPRSRSDDLSRSSLTLGPVTQE